MANIELVIKMPEEDYKHILHRQKEYCITTSELEDAIANGTPLPKGHGRIADIDEVLEEMKITRTYDIPFALERVKPIIKADTESESE